MGHQISFHWSRCHLNINMSFLYNTWITKKHNFVENTKETLTVHTELHTDSSAYYYVNPLNGSLINKGDGGVHTTHNLSCICCRVTPQPAGFSINNMTSLNVQFILIVVNPNVFVNGADNISPLDKRRIVVTIPTNSCSSPTLQGCGWAGLMPLASLFIDL